MEEMSIDHLSEICKTNNDKVHIRNICIVCMIIIVVQYTMTENVPFIGQFHENCNIIIIFHSPSQY